jgi:hypothetical protein
MRGLVELDLPEVLGNIGFEDIRIERFKEASGLDLDARDAWRFPWTAISAVKPRAA